MSLPYSSSKADPTKAMRRIRAMLQIFGVTKIGFDEDFDECVLCVRFVHNKYPVSLPVNYGTLADMYLEDDPYTTRKLKSESEWIADKREIAYRASYSLLEDFLKGMTMVIEMGIFSFEEIFIAHFVNQKGERLGEMMVKKLPEFVSGQLALKE